MPGCTPRAISSTTSHKSGAQTISHLRFGPHPIHAPYLIQQAGFIGCHQFQFIARQDVLRLAAPGATVLLNAPFGPDEVWDHLPRPMQRRIIELGLRLFVIDASRVAQEVGLRGRTNTVLQTCFFAISGVLPRDKAIEHIKQAIRKTYGGKGEAVVQANFRAVDETLARLFEVTVPDGADQPYGSVRPLVPDHAPAFVREVTAAMLEGRGDEIPVSQHAGGRHLAAPARRSGRSATSPRRCRSGRRISASSAASAVSSVRMA